MRVAKRRVSFFLIAILVVISGVFGIPSANAALLILSTHVSNAGSPPPPEQLDASFDFTVVEDITYGQVLELAVTNNTGQGGDPEYTIDTIWFNAPDELDDTAGLVMFDVINGPFGQWIKNTAYSENGFNVDGFADFDMQVADNKTAMIIPGETVTFRFDINGPGTYTGASFAYLMSQNSGDPMYAAAHFIRGIDDASSHGATNVPEPATMMLLGLGGLALRRRSGQTLRRRRRV